MNIRLDIGRELYLMSKVIVTRECFMYIQNIKTGSYLHINPQIKRPPIHRGLNVTLPPLLFQISSNSEC